jgi:hypothetical protein
VKFSFMLLPTAKSTDSGPEKRRRRKTNRRTNR